MTTFTFNSRETYLQYRSEWKAKYAALSATIRKERAERRLAQQEFSKHTYIFAYGTTLSAEVKEENIQYSKTYDVVCSKEDNLIKFRRDARNMLEELKEAKVEAGRQMRL